MKASVDTGVSRTHNTHVYVKLFMADTRTLPTHMHRFQTHNQLQPKIQPRLNRQLRTWVAKGMPWDLFACAPMHAGAGRLLVIQQQRSYDHCTAAHTPRLYLGRAHNLAKKCKHSTRCFYTTTHRAHSPCTRQLPFTSNALQQN